LQQHDEEVLLLPIKTRKRSGSCRMLDLMRPIPDIHLALAGPPPRMLEQSVLRTMGEKSSGHEWRADEVRATIPDGWPSGSVQEIDAALEQMVRWHMIWDGESGYRVAPPDDIPI
jgi:hypothetical protein